MKHFYIIPGYGESCTLKRYQALASVAQKKGYVVHEIDPDWAQPLSKQIFKIKKDATVFGFSFGAVIAYLSTKRYPCKKVIYASMSPINSWIVKDIVKHFTPEMGEKHATAYAKDIKSIRISLKKTKTPYVTVAGALEKGMDVDFLIPDTDHYMTKRYIAGIEKLL